MGHRHSPEEFCRADTITRVDPGSSAAAEESVKVLPTSSESAPVRQTQSQQQTPASEGGRYTVGTQPQCSWGVRTALFALNCYKSYLSPWFAGSCRFEPTCSRYAYEAIARFGVARGMWQGTKRLLRCHPLARKFGHDPVPEKWEEMPDDSTMISKTREVRP
jgi:uncharacterized protein